MKELYVLPNATVAYWGEDSLDRLGELTPKIVDNGEVEQVGRAFVALSMSGSEQ